MAPPGRRLGLAAIIPKSAPTAINHSGKDSLNGESDSYWLHLQAQILGLLAYSATFFC